MLVIRELATTTYHIPDLLWNLNRCHGDSPAERVIRMILVNTCTIIRHLATFNRKLLSCIHFHVIIMIISMISMLTLRS